MSGEFHKIRRLPPYVFEQVNRRKAELRAQGADIIDLGMGNPDMPAPPQGSSPPTTRTRGSTDDPDSISTRTAV